VNGVHDMGGMTDFGPVHREVDEPLFHEEWERRVFGLIRHTIDVRYNWDEFRFAIERLDPLVYLSASYYERWLAALERFLVEKRVVTPEDLSRALDEWAPQPGRPLPSGEQVEEFQPLEAGQLHPAFVVGDAVTARVMNPIGHTRLPRYVRGKTGVVERLLGSFVFPDANALGRGCFRRPVYAVRFDGRELWGNGGTGKTSICVDLWEEYLAPVEETVQAGAQRGGAA
jgi:nitrile hydratase subunit beta